MNLIEIMNNRYSTKKFDTTKKVSEENINEIKELLRLSSSSVNLQPWHFIIASSEEGKNKISKSTEGFFAFNKEKVVDASHVIVLCSKTSIDEDFLRNILDKEDADGRFASEEFKTGMHNGRVGFVNIHKDQYNDLQDWVDKQVYLNLGNLLLGVAALGIDSVPMEGFDAKILDQELGLTEKGLKPIAIVPIGYRASDDFNATIPKSRLNSEEIFTTI